MPFSTLCKHRVESDFEEDIKQLVCYSKPAEALLQLYAEESFTDAASEAVLHGKLALDLLQYDRLGLKFSF